MSQIVVDASIALAWCFPDETSAAAESVLVALEGKTILVPALWGLELANAILTGERKKRLSRADIEQFAALLANLPLVQDTRPVGEYFGDVLPVARAHGLSAYDAAYLELSIRRDAPLATLDKKLRHAASSAGIDLFEGAPT